MKKVIINAVGIGLLAVILAQFTLYDVTSLSFFSPTEKSIDFESSDFYQLVANAADERVLEDCIVIVPIDSLSRMEIAALVEDISLGEPAAIGLDVFFPYPAEHDSLLMQVLTETPSLVVPMGVEWQTDDSVAWRTMDAYLYDSLSLNQRGVINVNIGSTYHVVRSFRPYYPTERGDIPNFAVALAAQADPQAVERLKAELVEVQDTEEDVSGHGQELYINYGAREFEVIQPKDVLERIDEFSGKIVLIGAMEEMQDMHITPINETMPGVLVHAHVLATLLHGDYLTPVCRWIIWCIALVLCICFVVLSNYSLTLRAGNLIMRGFQLFAIVTIIVVGSLFFLHGRYILDLGFPLSLVALGLLALDLWNGILGIFHVKSI